jgi:farnesyl diphosphate synthase
MTFHDWISHRLARVEAALDACLPAADTLPLVDLPAAMRYSVLGGGKRVRPLLVYAAGEVCNAPAPALDAAACAVELIHAYSLVHDDMPCMDNDSLRRGKPTVHVQFGEATALLAGDALQALAFEALTPAAGIAPATQARLCALLARAAGSSGMAGGQAIDLAFVGKPLTQSQLKDMHQRKTGALLAVSVLMGAAAGDCSSAAHAQLKTYAEAVGIAFQVVDDILDCTADSATLGKTAGKDAAQDKPTYVSVLGLDAARAYADELRATAHAALQGLPLADNLRQIADLIVLRSH